MDPRFPEPPPFVVPLDRAAVTLEPSPGGGACNPLHNDREWVGWVDQGGGFVPPEHAWTSNPKQAQDDLSAK